MHQLLPLSDLECSARLGGAGIGRVVYTRHGLPAVATSRYLVREGALWFAAPPRSPVAKAVDGQVVAVHADRVDLDRREGWSVTGVGTCRLLGGTVAPFDVAQAWPGRTWSVFSVEVQRWSGRSLGEPVRHPVPDVLTPIPAGRA